MKKIEKILVCLDLSEYSTPAIDYAVEFAGDSDTEILLLNVLNQRDLNAVQLASAYYPDKLDLDRYVKEAKKERYDTIRTRSATSFQAAAKGKREPVRSSRLRGPMVVLGRPASP